MTKQRTFSQWLRRLRVEHNLTQEKLAEAVGCAPQTLRALESGKRRPSRAMAERIAEVLAVAADEQTEFLRLARRPLASVAAQPAVAVDKPSAPPAGPPSAVPLRRRLLVVDPAPLIGRTQELDTVTSLLREGSHPLVTIVGPGGMGKTKLAKQVARKLHDHFPDGAAFVPLASVATGHHVSTTVADALQISLQGAHNVLQRLVESLAERHLLLVLDNFEHLLAPDAREPSPALELLQQLMRHTPNVRLLVTSRERLRISREQTFELAGLATPDPTDPLAAAMEDAEAVQLFVERAQMVAGHFALTPENRQAVARICHVLDGMPLALELAAAWTRVLTCDEIAAEIQRNIDFLTLADRDMEARHRSMRAVFDHSWALLSAEEQAVLAQLAVFAGGCRREAAQTVAGASLPILAGLIDKSLLSKRQSATNTRYEMHELVRQYSISHLQQRGEEAAARRRHALLFLALAEAAHPNLRAAEQVAWLARLGEEHDNLRAALAWALHQGEIEVAARIGWSLWPFWWIRNYHNEGREWMDRVLARGEQLPLTLRTRATMSAEAMAYGQGDGAACEEYAVALMTLSQQAGRDAHAEAYAHAGFGLVATLRGDPTMALYHLEAALPLFRESGEEGMASQTETWIGTVHLVQGNYTAALLRFQAGLAYARRVGDRLGITNALFNLGQVALATDRLDDAAQYFTAGIPDSAEMGDRANIAYMLEGLAAVAGAQGAAEQAAQLFGAAQVLIERTGLRGHTYYQPDHARYAEIRTAVQTTLGEARYHTLWAVGRMMSLEEMVVLGGAGIANEPSLPIT